MTLSLISLEARWKARLPDGRPVFAKASGSDLASWRAEAVKRVARDRVCLQALRGLAVPRAVRLPASCLLPGVPPRSVVAQEWVRGRALDDAGLSKTELLGAWAFVSEQLVAFRRRQVLYTDLKCDNVLAARRPLAVTIIDFDCAVAVSDDGLYRSRDFGYTQGFEAPEQRDGRRLRESAVVYQLGMLLRHCWTGWHNDDAGGAARSRRELERGLAAQGAAPVAALVEHCLQPEPRRRPQTYEDVLRRLREPGVLPESATRVWKALRAPYAKALTETYLEL